MSGGVGCAANGPAPPNVNAGIEGVIGPRPARRVEVGWPSGEKGPLGVDAAAALVAAA